MPIVIVARYSIACLAIMIRYNACYTRRYTDSDCLLESTFVYLHRSAGLQKIQMQLWLTITNNGDNVFFRVRLLLKLANQKNVDTPKYNNMSHLRFESFIDSCAATLPPLISVVGEW